MKGTSGTEDPIRKEANPGNPGKNSELPAGGGLVGVAIRQPVFTTMIMVGLIVLGVFSLGKLSMDQFPDVSIPVVSIQTAFKGASPETVETEVTKKIEDVINTTQGVKVVSSTSIEGVSSITARFALGTPIEWAAADVRSKIRQIERDLPSGIEAPVVQQFDPSAEPILSLALGSDTRSIAELTALADGPIRRALEGVDGVGRVQVNGGLRREIHVLIDPDQILALGISVKEILDALEQQNIEAPAGSLASGNRELLVRVLGRIERPEQFRDVIVAERDDGPVRLSRVAVVREETEAPASATRINGKPAIGLDILKVAGANTVSVADGVQAVLARLKPALPAGVSLGVVRDNSVEIRGSVESVGHELLLGALLTVLIVLLFLNDFRATVITSLSLPVSVISAFILLYSMKFTLNILTLMALSLSIGLLIDDAIVVIENIVRRREQGESASLSAFIATREIFLAVMATTFSIVAVFVPVAFMGGVIGRFFYQFGLTVAWAVLVSLFVSFSLTPMLSAWWAREEPGPPPVRRGPARLLSFFNEKFDRVAQRYRGVIEWALRHRLMTLCAALLSFVAAMALFPAVGGSLMPDEDAAEFTVSFDAPPGSSLDYTVSRAEEIERVLKTIPEVVYTYTTAGSDLASTVTRGKTYVKLTPAAERKRSQQDLMTVARGKLQSLYGVTLSVMNTSSVLPTSGASDATKPILVSLYGSDLEELRRLSGDVIGTMRQVPGVIEVESSLAGDSPQVRLVVDVDAASELGLDPAFIGKMVSTVLAGEKATVWEGPGGEERKVIVRMPSGDLTDLGRIASLPIMTTMRSPSGTGFTSVPLGRVVRIEMAGGPAQIDRENLSRVLRISANLEQGTSLSKASEAIQVRLDGLKMPEGYKAQLGGDTTEMSDTMRTVGQSVLLAVIMIYLILGSQFGSFVQPLAIMFALPLSLVGVMLALLATGDTVNMMSMIGVIMLMGLVTKNSILLVDNANHHRSQGMSVEEALVEAGETRLRPIVMTTFAMIFGMLPIAIGVGEGAAFRAPMARAVIGGLITSTILTLAVVPVVYSLLENFSSWFKGKVLGKEAAPAPEQT